MTAVRMIVNGEQRSVDVDTRDTLLTVIRERLLLTGTKRGCDMGECGACTVLLDGRPVNSCMVLAVDAEGRDVQTIEGLTGDALNEIQRAFVEQGAVQCGFCTPGMILTTKALLDRCPDPVLSEVREALSGNLCRCTGYQKIVDAVLAAAHKLRETKASGKPSPSA